MARDGDTIPDPTAGPALCSICHVPIVLESTRVVPFRDCRTRGWFRRRRRASDHDDDDNERLTCGHTFHRSCLQRWFRRSPTCPNCRFDVRGTLLCLDPGRTASLARCVRRAAAVAESVGGGGVEPILFSVLATFGGSARLLPALTYVVLHGAPIVWVRSIVRETVRRSLMPWGLFEAALAAVLEERHLGGGEVDDPRDQQRRRLERLCDSSDGDPNLPEFMTCIPLDGVCLLSDRDFVDASMLVVEDGQIVEDLPSAPRRRHHDDDVVTPRQHAASAEPRARLRAPVVEAGDTRSSRRRPC